MTLLTEAAQVLATVLACCFASGVVFGFAAFKPVMIAEGVFRNMCTEDELQKGVDLCEKQDLRYALRIHS